MKCPECHSEIPTGFKFCHNCGAQLSGIQSKSHSHIPGERKQATIMFSDLSGYTSMSEKLDPEEVKSLMGRIFAEASRIVEKYEGTVERFFGDEVMALFGGSLAHEDDPIRAVKAAMEIHEFVEKIAPEFETIIGRPLKMHTGINTGLIVTGEEHLGKDRHGLTGDTINLAKRLANLANEGEIFIGPDTWQLTQTFLLADEMEPIQVSGKADPVKVYRALTMKDRPEKVHRIQGVRADLIGREKELGDLKAAVKDLEKGHGTVVSIVGEAGTGKSRLVQELKAGLSANQFQWHEGHAFGYTQTTPYYPLIHLLTQAFRIDEKDPTEKIKAKIDTGVISLLGETGNVAPYIGSLFSLTYPEIEEVSPEYWQTQLRETMGSLLSALVEANPTIICFEDLHWADTSSVELLQYLLEKIPSKALFICTYRPHFSFSNVSPTSKDEVANREICLKELDAPEIEVMLKSLLDTQYLPDTLAGFVLQKTEGNPFYLEETINSLIESNVLIRDNGIWKLSRSLVETDIPATIHGVLSARVDRLEQSFKRILQEASVIGRAFLYKILDRITHIDTNIDRYLLELENLDLIRTRSIEPELEYIFKHALTQDVVYNGLLKTERHEIHERIGLAIEQLFANRLPEFYETLALHFSLGKSINKAVEYLIKAGEKSLSRFALDASTNYFREAFDMMLLQQGRSDAENLIIVDILNRWAKVHYYRGSFVELESLLRSQEGIVELLGNKTQCGMYYAWLGMSLWANGQSGSSYNYLQKARSIGDETNSKMIIGYASIWLSFTCADLGSFTESISFAQEGYEIACQIKTDHYLYFKSLFAFSYNYAWVGNPAHYKPIVKEMIEYGEKHSHTRCLVVAYWSEGHMYSTAGDSEAAIRSYQKAIEVAIDPFYHFSSQLNSLVRLFQSGKMDQIKAILPDMLKYCDDTDNCFFNYTIDAISAVLEINNGYLSTGMKELQAIKARTKDSDFWFQNLIIEYTVAKVYLEVLKPSEPISILTMIRNPGFVLKHAFFAAKGAEKHLKKVVLMGNEKGAIGWVAQATLDLGILCKIKKRSQKASEYLEEAIRLFSKIEAYCYQEQAEAELSEIP